MTDLGPGPMLILPAILCLIGFLAGVAKRDRLFTAVAGFSFIVLLASIILMW